MALNGVAIFNDRGGNVPVDAGVLQSFDRAGAHPGPGNTYTIISLAILRGS
ncbi:MAG: hypothetical protein IPI78_12250 [Chitinophagaceae bacterium]|nr:hypothetical protein [Chitinophagaceae bacterium]